MLDLNEVFSLTEFQRNAREHVERLGKSGKPQVLTINGRAAVVVQDAAAYQRLLDEKQELEVIAGLRRGLDALKRGETRPIGAVVGALRSKHERSRGR